MKIATPGARAVLFSACNDDPYRTNKIATTWCVPGTDTSRRYRSCGRLKT